MKKYLWLSGILLVSLTIASGKETRLFYKHYEGLDTGKVKKYGNLERARFVIPSTVGACFSLEFDIISNTGKLPAAIGGMSRQHLGWIYLTGDKRFHARAKRGLKDATNVTISTDPAKDDPPALVTIMPDTEYRIKMNYRGDRCRFSIYKKDKDGLKEIYDSGEMDFIKHGLGESAEKMTGLLVIDRFFVEIDPADTDGEIKWDPVKKAIYLKTQGNEILVSEIKITGGKRR
ncbi:MAG: hypothetical protein Q7J98_02605 [Kiritimatiellia bacterium]|nr:hypothetical protein [Kiritimatiellia bacterium]